MKTVIAQRRWRLSRHSSSSSEEFCDSSNNDYCCDKYAVYYCFSEWGFNKWSRESAKAYGYFTCAVKVGEVEEP